MATKNPDPEERSMSAADHLAAAVEWFIAADEIWKTTRGRRQPETDMLIMLHFSQVQTLISIAHALLTEQKKGVID